MPDRAAILVDATCASCATVLLDVVYFQWGMLPTSMYRIGDAVQWFRKKDGTIAEPFTLRQGEPRGRQWNCGDPACADVVIFDQDYYDNGGAVICPKCGHRTAAFVVVVRGGRFERVDAVDDAGIDRILGPSRGKADIAVVREDGSFWPREDWYEHTIEYVPDASNRKAAPKDGLSRSSFREG